MEGSKMTSSIIRNMVFGILLRLVLIGRVEFVKILPHFQTSYNDFRQVKDMFVNYENQGEFYVDPKGVYQPLIYVKILHLIN